MGWSYGYDSNLKRDIGYGVPAICDDPECEREIDRGLSYVCGGNLYGGEKGCGLHFCSHHLWMKRDGTQLCRRCTDGKEPFKPKPDTREWIEWKLTHESWADWRDAEPDEVARLQAGLSSPALPRTEGA